MTIGSRLARITRFDRWDLLGTRLLLLATIAVVAVVGLIRPIAAWVRGAPLTWHIDTAVRPEASGARPGVTAIHDGTMELTIAHASPGVRLATLLPGAVTLAAVSLVAWLVWKLLAAIQAGHPFAAASAWWLRGIALTLIVVPIFFGFATGLANGLVTHAALSTPTPLPTVFLTLNLASYALLPGTGLIVAGVAEAFARGARLQEDVDGLV